MRHIYIVGRFCNDHLCITKSADCVGRVNTCFFVQYDYHGVHEGKDDLQRFNCDKILLSYYADCPDRYDCCCRYNDIISRNPLVKITACRTKSPRSFPLTNSNLVTTWTSINIKAPKGKYEGWDDGPICDRKRYREILIRCYSTIPHNVGKLAQALR